MKWPRATSGKQRGASLLIEPTIEQELESLGIASQKPTGDTNSKPDIQLSQNSSHAKKIAKRFVILSDADRESSLAPTKSKSKHYDSPSPSKPRSKSELTSLLVILFGPLLLLCALNACLCHQAPVSGRASHVLPRNATDGPKSPRLENLTLASESEELTTTAPISMILTRDDADQPLVSSSLDDIDLGEEDGGPSTSGNETSGAEPSNNFLKIASDGADFLVEKLKPTQPDSEGDELVDSADIDLDEGKSNSTRAQGTGNSPESSADQLSAGHSRAQRNQLEMASELRIAMQTYGKWRQVSDEVIDLFSRKLLPIIVEHGYDVDAGTVAGLLQVFNGIRSLKPWALKILDASAKLSPGVLVGTQSDFGDFDECLNVRVDDPSGLATGNPDLMGELDKDTGLYASTLVGKYCLADIEFPKPPRERLATRNEELQTDFAPIELRRPLLNFSETAAFKETIFVETGNFFHMLYVDPLRVGICLTNKIDADNFASVFNKLIEEFRVKINFHGRCVTKYDKVQWTSYQIASAYIITVGCALVCLCTSLDLLHSKLNKLPLPSSLTDWKCKFRRSLFKYWPIFTSFSLIRNTKRLFKPQTKPTSPTRTANIFAKNLNNQQPVAHGPSLDGNGSLGPGFSSVPTLTDSSVESSPSIERRSVSVSGSAVNLISNSDSTSLVATGMAQPVASCSSAPDDVNLLCLHGIRVITMTWMIVNHTYLFGGFFVLWAHRRLIDITEWPKSVSFQLVLNGWLTVETYFFLSAAIIVLNLMPLLKRRRFSYVSYILHRLLRLMPAYVGLVCLNFLWPLISSGPVWLVKGKSFIQTPCENYLWTNFLFINNWIWPEKQCMVHTWFLSADFQLYLVAPLIVYFLYRRPVLGHSLNLILAIVASVFSGFVIYANKLMPTTLINKLEFDSIKQQLSYSYFATYQHMGPYCLGILTGYMLHKRPNVRLPKHLSWLLWLLLPPLSFTTLLLTYLWNGAYDDPALINPSPLVSALYVAIHRTIWTSLVAWIVFSCATGRARLMSSFLSHSVFIPLSRLSFSIYLVHLPVIMFRALNLRHTIEWTDTNILWEACGNFAVSIVVGYFVNITFESPIINLERVIFGRGNDQKSTYQQNLRQAETGLGKVVGGRGAVPPQAASQHKNGTISTSSVVDSDNKSDSNNSSTLSERMTESSPEQERKSDRLLSSIESSTKGDMVSSPPEGSCGSQLDWTRAHVNGSVGLAQDQRKSLRLRDSSVEPPRGNQANPLSGVSDLGAEKEAAFTQQYYSASSEPPEAEGDVSGDTRIPFSRKYLNKLESNLPDLYQSEFNPYARRGGYHHWRLGAGPTQYATLSTSSSRRSRLQLIEQQQPHCLTSVGVVPKSRSLLSEPNAIPSRHYEPVVSGREFQGEQLMEPKSLLADARQQIFASQQQQQQFHQSTLRKRPGRYNTLTGIGSREWRSMRNRDRGPDSHYYNDNYNQIYSDADIANQVDDDSVTWRRLRPMQEAEIDNRVNDELRSNSSSYLPSPSNNLGDNGASIAGGWLQSGGVMIPRIDSSTLRRNMIRSEVQPTDSIIEESNSIDQEDVEASVL